MATFEPALAYMLKHEGGWSDDPYDKGGATNFGITFALAKRYGIDTETSLRLITPQQVATIYRCEFWKFDGIQDQRVASKIFDMCVNMGPGHAIKLLQCALNSMGIMIKVDGVYGIHTQEATNSIAAISVLSALQEECSDYYKSVVDNNPSQRKFLKGWLNRAMEVPL